MRIRVVSLLNIESGVGRVTASTFSRLKNEYSDLAIIPLDRPPYHHTEVQVIELKGEHARLRELRKADLAVYVLSDSSQVSEAVALSYEQPGLAILHDVNLFHALAPMAQRYVGKAPHEWLDLSRKSKSERRGNFSSIWSGRAEVSKEPLGLRGSPSFLGPALLGASTCMTHSAWAASTISDFSTGPVFWSPLPWTSSEESTFAQTITKQYMTSPYFAVVGHVNDNRNVDVIVGAISQLRLRGLHANLVVAGPTDEAIQAKIISRIRPQDRELPIFTGRVSESEMRAILQGTRGSIILRDPVVEASSASVLESMSNGAPVVVIDHCHYSELPDDAVVKVAPGSVAADLPGVLEELMVDHSRSEVIGAKGRDYAADPSRMSEYTRTLNVAIRSAFERVAMVAGFSDARKVWSHDGFNVNLALANLNAVDLMLRFGVADPGR